MAPWSGSALNQQFTRTDGTRSGDDTWQHAAAAPVDIVAPDHDNHDTDVANGVNVCLKKDGGNTATADIPMGGFTLTNIAAAGARTESASFADVQDNKAEYVATVGGTADAITLTPTIAITAYVAGQRFSFIAGGDNTAATTVSVSAVGAKSVVRNDGANTALAGGDIQAGAIVDIEYDGTRFLLLTWDQRGVLDAPSGTAMLFVQTAAPTGWTKSTTHNDKALRVVSGTASSGGSTAFSTVFASRTPQGTVGNTTLTVDQIPAHSHVLSGTRVAEDNNNTPGSTFPLREGGGASQGAFSTSDEIENTGGGQSHTHTFTGTAMDFAVHYVDAIIATKD